MQRTLYEQLVRWKNDPGKKPLILTGARQVGKTYLVHEFGRREFSSLVVVNCDAQPRLNTLLEQGLDPKRLIEGLELITAKRIIAGETLLFLDEVQQAPRLLAALKYFHELAPQYHVIAAGSLLGQAVRRGASYPVGCVDELTLYPLSFSEYVRAVKGDGAWELLLHRDPEELNATAAVFEDLLRHYYFTGGMPEVVQAYVDGKSPEALRGVQLKILGGYTQDISKHAEQDILGRIHQVLASLPRQLVNAHRKFHYGHIQKGARAREFEPAIEWLVDAGVVSKVARVSKAALPLKFYEDPAAFKLFFLDHGLLGAMVDAPVAEILLGGTKFEEYRGAFTKQYVFEQLRSATGSGIFFYDSQTSRLELDFLLQRGSTLVPIEVKAAENLRSKSLKQFCLTHPDCCPIRFSLSRYRKEETLINCPLFAAERINEL